MTLGRWFIKLMSAVLLCFCALPLARASEYFGQITFGGLPVPGATIIATQGSKTFNVTSDEGGVFHFDDLPDGQWKIQITMLCFETVDADVTIAPKMSGAKYELKLLPADQLRAVGNGAAFPCTKACTAGRRQEAGERLFAGTTGDAEAARRRESAKL